MQGWFDIQNYKISILTDKKIMIISIGTEKAFGKIQHILMTKKTKQIRDRRKVPQPDNGHLGKRTTNIVLNGERKTECFPHKKQTKALTFTTPTQHCTGGSQQGS